jgi:hypothetical protein
VTFSNFSLPAVLNNIPPYPLALTPQNTNFQNPYALALQNFQRAQLPLVGDNLYLTEDGLKALTVGIRTDFEQLNHRLSKMQEQLQQIQQHLESASRPSPQLNLTA